MPSPVTNLVRLVWCTTLSLCAPSVAGAGADEVREWGEYYLAVDQPLKAARAASEALEQDPTDLQAHEVYIMAWLFLGEIEVLEIQYRSWYAEDPDDETRRMALACVTLYPSGHRYDAETEDLLTPLPEDPAHRLWALQMFHELWMREDAPWDPEDVVDEMEQLAEEYGPAAAEATFRRAAHQPVDELLAEAMTDHLDAGRIDIAETTRWLWHGAATGSNLIDVQERVIEEAREAVDSDDPRETLRAGAVLFRAGKHEEAETAWQRTEALDPDAEGFQRDPRYREISAATKRLDPAVALKDLGALESEIPDDGAIRSQFEAARAGVLSSMGRKRPAMRARRASCGADPTSVGAALRFGLMALHLQQDQELAVDAIEASLASCAALEYEMSDASRIRGYDWWLERKRKRYCRTLDLKAQLLQQIGRRDEATAAWLSSLMVLDDPVTHLRLGMHYKGQGQLDLAFEHLALGLAQAPTERPDLDTEAMTTLQALFPYRPYWNAGSLDAYLTVRASTLEGPEDEPEQRDLLADLIAQRSQAHPFERRQFPDLSFDVDGEQRMLSDYDGILVVELWNTW